MVIPDLRTGYSRVTHPSAAVLGPKPFPARLACVRRAASVRPEPGSNPQGKFDPALPLSQEEGGRNFSIGPKVKRYSIFKDPIFNYKTFTSFVKRGQTIFKRTY